MKTYPKQNVILYATVRAPHEVRGTFYEHFIGQVPGQAQAKVVKTYPEVPGQA